MATGITAEELRALLESGTAVDVLDVRSPEEFAAGHHPRARNVPADAIGTAEVGGAVVCICTKGGGRSQGAADALTARGLDARYLVGGVLGLGIAAPRHG